MAFIFLQGFECFVSQDNVTLDFDPVSALIE